MNTEHCVTPVVLHLVANPQLAPGAIRMVVDTHSGETLTWLATEPALAALTAQFPCLLDAATLADLDETQRSALVGAGCQPLLAQNLSRSDALTRPNLPPTANWLEGDWMLAPPQRPTAAQSASRTLSLKLLQMVMADAETRDIEAVLRQDPALSYHLLRLVNSLGMGLTRRIASFSQAIMILGRNQLRRWLNLMLFAARSDDYRTPMLLARVVVRARSMELLARESGLDRSAQDLAFMAGMFSMLGVLFGSPLTELIKPLQLSADLVEAIIEQKGETGRLLQLMVCAESGDLPGVARLLADLQLSPLQFSQIHLDAHQWMLGMTRDPTGDVDD